VTRAKVPMSRPLRAFGVVIAGWTLVRIAVLWHLPIDIALPPAAAKLADKAYPAAETAQTQTKVNAFFKRSITILLDDAAPVSGDRPVKSAVLIPRGTPRHATGLSIILDPDTNVPPFAGVPPVLPRGMNARRLSGSAWALLRPDSGGAAFGAGGTLGGSQIGARFFVETGVRKLALTARLSAPLAMRTGREASVGVAIRGRSVGILIERRIALDKGARNVMSATAYGGISDVALPHGFVLDGYTQFGIVGLHSRDMFGDGAARILRPFFRSDVAKLSIGSSISGGFQPGVSRVDIGPELIADLPVVATPVRLSVGWRQRVAGNAAPGSGLSISVGFGF
jgi:hypothetical protein